MPIRPSKKQVNELLMQADKQPRSADLELRSFSPIASVLFADVFIAGSGPIACTYASHIIKNHKTAKVVMTEIGSQDNPVVGAHHKNSIKYQKDIDSFVNVIKGALQPISIPPTDTHLSTLAGAAWAPPISPNPGGQTLVIQGHNPDQRRELNLTASAVTRTVGGMATHWTCACPVPHEEERKNNPINKDEFNGLLDRSKVLLNVHTDQFDDSIRHTIVKDTLTTPALLNRVSNLPLAVQRRQENKDFVTWTGCDTILGDTVKSNRFKLLTEKRVTRLVPAYANSKRIGGVLVRDLTTNNDILVVAESYIIACGAVCTPQILYNSNIRPHALGRYLSEQSMAFCQIVLKRSIVDSIFNYPQFQDRINRHKEKYPKDPLPIPFNDPEPQVMLPYDSSFPWHVQIHRDAFSYGDIGPRADPRVVVDLRFFGKSEICEGNRVIFSKDVSVPGHPWETQPEYTDIYGMPQASFHVQRTKADGDRDQRMMNDLTNVANDLGGFLPGSYPQFMEPGLALHITGTTRIGTNPRTSVADPSSKVHNFNNLWVGGNGCIPDSTASNPTLTSVAIALKGAESVVEFLNDALRPKPPA